MSDFGDYEPEDAYSAEGEPDPLQMAIRYHRIREYLADVSGQPFPRWEDLPDGERILAVSIFIDIVRWLQRQGTMR